MNNSRNEEITEKAKETYRAGAQNSLQFRTGFCTGAEWADQHPRKGLWDSEKVIEWLRNNQHGFILTDIDIEDLTKAMED